MGRALNPAAAVAAPKRGSSARARDERYEGWSSDRERNHELVGHAAFCGNWIPGAEGTERPFRTRSGARLLWCWRPATGEHAYLNCDTDIILSDEQASMLRGEPAGPGRHRPSAERCREMVQRALPDDGWQDGRFQRVNRRRFPSGGDDVPAGSLTGAGSLGALLERAVSERGSLNGDDREELLTLGADPAAFRAHLRYLKVICDGIGDVADVRRLAPSTPLLAGAGGELEVSARAGAFAARTFVATVILNVDGTVADVHPGPPRQLARVRGVAAGVTVTAADAAQLIASDGSAWALMRGSAPAEPETGPQDAFSALLGNRRG